MGYTQRRRHFGVAAFGHVALHTVLYFIDMGTLSAILGEFLLFGIWTGWLAMFVFLPLALSSNNYFVRLLGPAWKNSSPASLRRRGRNAPALDIHP